MRISRVIPAPPSYDVQNEAGDDIGLIDTANHEVVFYPYVYKKAKFTIKDLAEIVAAMEKINGNS